MPPGTQKRRQNPVEAGDNEPATQQPSQNTSYLLPENDRVNGQLRVVYEDDGYGRSELSGGDERKNRRRSAETARRGRRRKFVTRHHLDEGDSEEGRGQGDGVDIGRALRDLRGGFGMGVGPSTSNGSSVEVQGRERLTGMSGVKQAAQANMRTMPTMTPATQGFTQELTRGPITMGSGRHALVLDASMVQMINASTASVGRGGGADRRGGRGARSAPGGRNPNKVRRREGMRRSAQNPHVQNPLSSKLLAQKPEEGRSFQETPNRSLDAFVSQLQAPSPDRAPVRVRMRAPTSLAQQASTLQPRLQFDATNARGVSTLRLRVREVEEEYGKIKCLCQCDHPMGVFEGETALVVMKQTVELGEVREGVGLILNKPWLVLEGNLEDGLTLPAVFCLGDVSII